MILVGISFINNSREYVSVTFHLCLLATNLGLNKTWHRWKSRVTHFFVSESFWKKLPYHSSRHIQVIKRFKSTSTFWSYENGILWHNCHPGFSCPNFLERQSFASMNMVFFPNIPIPTPPKKHTAVDGFEMYIPCFIHGSFLEKLLFQPLNISLPKTNMTRESSI